MYAMAMVLVGFITGLLTMALISFYKWVLEVWNKGFT